METPEQYNLSWKNFRECTTNTFRELLKQQEFADVTLVCEDDKQLHAHKVILSACSPFFKKILMKNPHQHPLIYLTGVSRQYLSSMVSFMYLGQTNVAQEDLTGFMAAASKYQIKGLSEEKEKIPATKRGQDTSSLPYVESILEANIEERPATFMATKPLKLENDFEENQMAATGEEENFEPSMETSFTEPALEETPTGRSRWETGVFDDANYESFRQYDDSFACDHCQFSTKNKSNLKAHRNAKHLGVKYPCDKCDYKASYSNHLRQHKRVKHEGVNFPCDQCTFQTSQKSKLKLHIREKHGSSTTVDNSANNVSLDNNVVASSNTNNSIIHNNSNYNNSSTLPQTQHLHEDPVMTSNPSLHSEDASLHLTTSSMQEPLPVSGLQSDHGMAINSSPSIQYLTQQLNNLVNQVNPLTHTDRDLV